MWLVWVVVAQAVSVGKNRVFRVRMEEATPVSERIAASAGPAAALTRLRLRDTAR